MAKKKIRFPLEMSDGTRVHSLDELREHFDLGSVLGYYKNGKLLAWLNDRYMEDEAEAVSALDETAPDFQEQLCAVFGLEFQGQKLDLDEIESRQERLKRLRQFTDEEVYIGHIDQVAFDQDDLLDLLDEGTETIYLCGEKFTVPTSQKGKTYIGINRPEVKISGKYSPDDLGIQFKGCLVEQLGRVEKSDTESKLDETYAGKGTLEHEIVISAHIEVDSSEHKEFKDSRIIFKDTIDCNGTLSFERCDIICNLADISNQSLQFRTGILKADDGTVLFRNCKITFVQENEELYFLHAIDTTVGFDDCHFFGCKNILYANACEDISFTSCTGKEIKTPFYVGYSNCSIKLTNCTFVSALDSITPVKVNYGKISIDSGKSLFKLARDEISITNSHFEGFMKGVFEGIPSDMSVDNTAFVECIGILTDRASEAQFNKCRFERSFSLFCGKEISVEGCDFIDCYGAIEVDSFQCDSSRFAHGLLVINTPHYTSGRGESSFSSCIFEDIDMREAKSILSTSSKNGFKYISFASKEDVDTVIGGSGNTLLDVGNTGRISDCQFRNIRLNDLRFMIGCGQNMDIEDSTFDRCSVSESILDKTVYTHYRGGLFDRGTKRQADYSISNCRGLKD